MNLIIEQNNKILDQNKRILHGQKALFELLESQKTKKNKPEDEPIDSSLLMPTFPITTAADMMDFDSKVRNQFYAKQVILRFKRVRGLSSDEPIKGVKKILEHIATYDVFQQFSWSGRSKIGNGADVTKLEFIALTGIHNILFGLLPQFNEKEIKEAIKYFMRRVLQNVRHRS